MSGHKHTSHKYHPYCLNCHYPLAEFDTYCPNCGQKSTDGKVSVHDLWHEFLHTTLHLDGKFFTTLKHIFIPGKLTEVFFKGQQKRYAHPVQLFLVLSSLSVVVAALGSGSKGLDKQVDETIGSSIEEMHHKQLILKLDSLAVLMPEYKQNPAVKQVLDSLLQSYYEHGLNNTREGLAGAYETSVKEIEHLKRKLKLLENAPENAKEDVLRQKARAFYKDKLEVAYLDSVRHLTGMAFREGKSTAAKHTELIAVKSEDNMETRSEADLSHETIAQVLSEFEKMDTAKVNKKVKYKSQIQIGGVKVNFVDGDRGKSQADSLGVRKYENATMGITGYSGRQYEIDEEDVYKLDIESLYKKYKVEGFADKLIVKQATKLRKTGKDFVKMFKKNLFYAALFSVLPMAIFFQFFYRRQKRFYAEHVVFLMHFTCMIALISMVIPILRFMGFESDLLAFLVAIWVLLAFLFALKRYYKQSWVKTMFKGFLLSGTFLIVSAMLVVLGLVASLLIF
jgi:hypothetical protein